MPLRSLPFPIVPPRSQGLFHTSAIRRDDFRTQNHYEILQIPNNASPAEVKKSFYSLSKTHHPDRNPDDPSASARFVQISTAYTVLSTPAKRREYDREHLNIHSGSQGSSNPVPRGSYHSSGPAGGRPASGLSQRRTQFRGPPPSFYRNGGWGEHPEKRKAAQNTAADTGAGRGAGGMGYGQGQRDEEVPHFDRQAHYKTQENQAKRQGRKGMHDWVKDAETHGSTLGNFVFVSLVLSLGIIVPGVLLGRMSGK